MSQFGQNNGKVAQIAPGAAFKTTAFSKFSPRRYRLFEKMLAANTKASHKGLITETEAYFEQLNVSFNKKDR